MDSLLQGCAQWHVASNRGGGDLLEPSRRLGLAGTIPEACWQGVFEDLGVSKVMGAPPNHPFL